MEKQKSKVILRPKDIHSELLDHIERAQIQYKFDKEVMAMMDKDMADDEYKDVMGELLQKKWRDILAITRPRFDKHDVLGRPILSTEEYKDRIAGMTEDEVMQFKKTITAPVTFRRNGEPHVVQVDHNLAPFLQRMADAGYGTGQSDSGTLSDHPNYRYVSDSV